MLPCKLLNGLERLEAITEHLFGWGSQFTSSRAFGRKFIKRKIQQEVSASNLIWCAKSGRLWQDLTYLTEHLPDVVLYVTVLTIKGSLEEQDLGDIQALLHIRFYR